MLQNGTTQEYNQCNERCRRMVGMVIMIVGTALIAWLSGLVGCKLLRKQLKRLVLQHDRRNTKKKMGYMF